MKLADICALERREMQLRIAQLKVEIKDKKTPTKSWGTAAASW